MRLIDADAWLRETHFKEGIYPHEMLKKEIEGQPTIEAEPVKHSVWAYDGKPIHCKKCGFEPNYALTEKNSVYCPHCGRRMDGDFHSG